MCNEISETEHQAENISETDSDIFSFISGDQSAVGHSCEFQERKEPPNDIN